MSQLKQHQKTHNNRMLLLALIGALTLTTFVLRGIAKPAPPSAPNKIFAQSLIERTLTKHPELEGIGLATIPPNGHDCVNIADTDTKEVGEKCDKGELTVMKTNKGTVEKEGDAYDVTVPLQVGGKTIGIISMDFKLNQQEAGLLDRAKEIAKQIEDEIPTKSKLFEAAQ
jgi:hypothetical protein